MIQIVEMGDKSLQIGYPMPAVNNKYSYPFSVNCMGDYVCDDRYFTTRKGLEECLLMYTLEGKGQVKYNGLEHILEPGQTMVLDCRKFHSYATLEDSWHFLWIHFSGKCAFDYVDMLNSDGGVPLSIHNRIYFREEFRKILSHSEKPALNWELEVAVIMQRLLTNMIILKKENALLKQFRYQKEMDDAKAYIASNYMNALSVDEIAQMCHLSKYYFIRIFKTYTGQTPYEYIISFRLRQSQLLLMNSDKTIEEIALETGFSTSKYYISCFKKWFGTTPFKYRKQN